MDFGATAKYLVRGGTRLKRITLRGFDLAGIDLQGTFLASADLQECNLHLAGANLIVSHYLGFCTITNRPTINECQSLQPKQPNGKTHRRLATSNLAPPAFNSPLHLNC
ncbi:MAG: pentapeptide repeat-containing protein [Pelatocladus maniniholoensis HA4357-MV3]|uniref:Pentapeptide repeat-containing protein n=1 Tax=Pelatocladus maniniholoensis HA4357-MV3 TaxID=1117104 RepID=A0A9E3HCP8_9NOST|nr:pentapeptide repeat-containing protein [Pelatocladus maniniholoensis HA4357-MV3]